MRRGLVLLALVAACDDAVINQQDEAGFASSSILISADESWIYLASSDDDHIVRLSADTLTVEANWPLAGAPVGLAFAGDALAVALRQGADAVLLDPATGAITRVAVPCGGLSAVVATADAAFFACPNDDRVVEIALPEARLRHVLEAPGRPTALALSAEALAVTANGRLRLVDRKALATLPTGPQPQQVRWRDDRALETTAGHAATRVDAVTPTAQGFITAFQRVEHDADRDRPPEQGGYGSVIDGQPRIEPRLDGCGPTYARFDGGLRVFSGPHALAYSPATGLLWVVHQFTDNIAVLDCAAEGGPALRAVFRVGRGPRGIALSADGRHAFVDVAFDAAVARLDLPDARADRPLEAGLTRTRPLGPSALDLTARRGRQLFHDAVNTHLTPSGIVTCATCHPDGGEDGLRWFLHLPDVPRKLRRTPPAWGARRRLAPFHWDGEFADVESLTLATVRALMEGDGLLIDAAAIAAWLDVVPPPPGRPAADAADAAVIAEGEAAFAAAGCAECHPAPDFSDAKAHALGALSADPDGQLDAVDTPALRGVRARPPFWHDGRAADLAMAIDAHGLDTAPADPATRAALVRYLETL
ncbi:MAG: hypothetical protein KC620_02320 [Myxococcales bacterium]|nr:hypothetical protein [Myxococcales bacterium]